MPPNNPQPFQLLEINVISGQDLAPVSKSMRTYAVVWVRSDRKLTTRVDQTGHINPQWNEKFVFRVDETFLNSDNSSIMIEIYAAAWLRDVQIGSVRVLISNLFPSAPASNSKMKFVALQIRRPSGRPQGILNMGVQLLDSTMRSMPFYTELSASALGFNDLINAKTSNKQPTMEEKTAQLRRTRSEHTDLLSSNGGSRGKGDRRTGNPGFNDGSVTTSSTFGTRSMGDKDKDKYKNKNKDKDNDNGLIDNGRSSMISDVGPSASVVAAAIARGLIKTPGGPPKRSDGSPIIEDWTESDSAEGLRTKLERWRSEMPPIYDTDAKNVKSSKKNRGIFRRRKAASSPGLFTCFVNVLGCEISFSCGGGGSPKYQGQGQSQSQSQGQYGRLTSTDSSTL